MTVRFFYRKFQKSSKMIVKLLPSFDRGKSDDEAKSTLIRVLHYKKKYPNLIKGIDFSGYPSDFFSFSVFEKSLQEARDNGLKLAIHCAERSTSTDKYEMLYFGMDRIGHGTYLTCKNKFLIS